MTLKLRWARERRVSQSHESQPATRNPPSLPPPPPQSGPGRKERKEKNSKKTSGVWGRGMNHQEEALRSGNHTQQLPLPPGQWLFPWAPLLPLGGEQTQKHLAGARRLRFITVLLPNRDLYSLRLGVSGYVVALAGVEIRPQEILIGTGVRPQAVFLREHSSRGKSPSLLL